MILVERPRRSVEDRLDEFPKKIPVQDTTLLSVWFPRNADCRDDDTISPLSPPTPPPSRDETFSGMVEPARDDLAQNSLPVGAVQPFADNDLDRSTLSSVIWEHLREIPDRLFCSHAVKIDRLHNPLSATSGNWFRGVAFLSINRFDRDVLRPERAHRVQEERFRSVRWRVLKPRPCLHDLPHRCPSILIRHFPD